MTTLNEIEKAIEKLPPEELSELVAWLGEKAKDRAPEVRYIDAETAEASTEKIFKHYAPLFKKLAE